MTDEEKRRRKKQEEERKRREAELKQKQKKRLSLHQKHKDRRRKDNMIGLPFIIAYQGDPARGFYCNDVKVFGVHNYELIHDNKQDNLLIRDKAFQRLRRYLSHKVMSMQAKILIWNAGVKYD